MDRNNPTATKQKLEPKKRKEFPGLGLKKKPLKAGKDAGGVEVKAKLEAMKKLAQVSTKSTEDAPGNNEDSSGSSRNKGIHKYAQEVVKDALQKRNNEKYQVSNPIMRKKKCTDASSQGLERKNVESPQLTNEQVEGLMRKFNEKANINIGERVSLANELGLSEKQVQTWFSSRRTKMKKTQELAELMAGSGPDTNKQNGPNLNRLTMKKGRGLNAKALPQSKEDAAVLQSAVAEENHEVIDVIDEEEDLFYREKKHDAAKDLPLLKPPSNSRVDRKIGTNQIKSALGCSDTKTKVRQICLYKKLRTFERLKSGCS